MARGRRVTLERAGFVLAVLGVVIGLVATNPQAIGENVAVWVAFVQARIPAIPAEETQSLLGIIAIVIGLTGVGLVLWSRFAPAAAVAGASVHLELPDLTPRAAAAPSGKPLRIESDGLLWEWTGQWSSGTEMPIVRGLCPMHRARPLVRVPIFGEPRLLEEVPEFDLTLTVEHGGGIVWCADAGGHTLSVTGSVNYKEAAIKAAAIMEARLRERDRQSMLPSD